MSESIPIAGFYRASLYSNLLAPPTFCSASRSQKNTLGVSDSVVQFQLRLLSSPWLEGVVSFHPCPPSHPPPPRASSGMYLLFIRSWFDSIRLPRNMLLAFFFQLSHFIAILDIHHSWCKGSGESMRSGMEKERRMEKMNKMKWCLLFWLWKRQWISSAVVPNCTLRERLCFLLRRFTADLTVLKEIHKANVALK